MKKILIIALLFAPMFVTANESSCVNQNILAYYTPETMMAQDRIMFYVPSFVKISSLEASFNGISEPVQYKNFGFITRAKVLIPQDLSGSIEATIGAQSVSGCKAPLSFSFSR